jgi:energy-coupling factor transporter transmembrane protein EcfT
MSVSDIAAFIIAMLIIWLVASPFLLLAWVICSIAWNFIKLAWLLVVFVGALAGLVFGALLWTAGWGWELMKKERPDLDDPIVTINFTDEAEVGRTVDLRKNWRGVYVPRNS